MKNNKCTDCGKEIYRYAIRCNSCSKKGKLGHNFKDGRCSKTYFCIDCSKEINRNTFLYKLGRCHSCAKKGSRNGNYIDGRSSEIYPSECTSYLKAKIRKRDNYTCQGKDCGITEKQHLILYDRVLDIHHIDYDKQNINLGNLISLCHRCNIKANFNREYWENYYSSIISDLILV